MPPVERRVERKINPAKLADAVETFADPRNRLVAQVRLPEAVNAVAVE